jgi:hypothetical protein
MWTLVGSAAVFVWAGLGSRLEAAINAAWDEDVQAASTSEPLTVTVSRSTIILVFCSFPVFLDGAPNPFRAHGSEPKGSLEDNHGPSTLS